MNVFKQTMKHIRAKAYLGVGVYLLAGPLLQEADASIPADDLELPLERALTLAQIQDPSLARIEAELKATGQEARDLGKWRAPEFRFQVDEDNSSKNRSEYAIRLRPPNPWVRRRKQQAIRREELDLHLDYARTLAELNREVSQQYFQTLFQRNLAKLTKDLVAISQVSDDIYQQGLNTGGVRFVDAIDARLDLAEAKVRLKEAEREERLLRGQLFRICGLSRSDSRLLTSTFASLTELPGGPNPAFRQSRATASHESALPASDKRTGASRVRTFAPRISFIEPSFSANAGRSDEREWGFRFGVELGGKWWPWDRVPGEVQNPMAGTGNISPASIVSGSSESGIQTAFVDLEFARSLALELLHEEAELTRQVKAFLSEESGAARPEIRRETQIRQRLIEFQITRLKAHYQYQLHLADYQYATSLAQVR